jgi:hypothetical protein
MLAALKTMTGINTTSKSLPSLSIQLVSLGDKAGRGVKLINRLHKVQRSIIN